MKCMPYSPQLLINFLDTWSNMSTFSHSFGFFFTIKDVIAIVFLIGHIKSNNRYPKKGTCRFQQKHVEVISTLEM